MTEVEESPNPSMTIPGNAPTRFGTAPNNGQPHSHRVTPTELQNFTAAFDRLVDDILLEAAFLRSQEAQDWLETVLHYNIPCGSLGRGQLLLSTHKYCTFEKEEDIPSRIYTLGWCLEFFQAFGLIYDDVVDKATLRRGKPSWHLHQDIGLRSYIDGFYVYVAIYELLEKYFQGQSCHMELVDTFHEAGFGSIVAIKLENQTCEEKNFDTFTRERQAAIAKRKTSYMVGLPVVIGMVAAEKLDMSLLSDMEKVALDTVYYFQSMDDYLDCFCEVSLDKDNDTDIANGSCSWPIVVALELASEEQRQILKENYGMKDPDKIARVKAVYTDLNLPKVYVSEQEERFKDIQNTIRQLPESMPGPVLQDLLLKYHSKIPSK